MKLMKSLTILLAILVSLVLHSDVEAATPWPSHITFKQNCYTAEAQNDLQAGAPFKFGSRLYTFVKVEGDYTVHSFNGDGVTSGVLIYDWTTIAKPYITQRIRVPWTATRDATCTDCKNKIYGKVSSYGGWMYAVNGLSRTQFASQPTYDADMRSWFCENVTVSNTEYAKPYCVGTIIEWLFQDQVPWGAQYTPSGVCSEDHTYP